MQRYPKNEDRQIKKSILRSLRTITLASALFTLPAAESAFAQPSTQQQAATQQNAKIECQIEETDRSMKPTKVHLASKKQREVEAFYTLGADAQQGKPKPIIKCIGPAKVVVEIYPLINTKQQNDGDPLALSYTIDGKTITRNEVIKLSDLSMKDAKHKKYDISLGEYVIALPMKREFTIGAGTHELLILSPPGFLRWVSSEEMKPLHLPQPVPQSQQIVIKKPEPKPVENKSPVLDFRGKRMEFVSGKSSGDINELDGVVAVKNLGSHVSLLAGTHLSSHGISSTYPDGTADLRLGSFNLGVGVSLSGRGHTVSALPFAGARIIFPSFSGLSPARETAFEFGGTMRYIFKDRFGATATGSNNPANPVSFSAFAKVPYGWVKGFYPQLELDARWVHIFRDNRVEGDTLVVPLHGNDILARAMVSIPIYDFVRNSSRFSVVPVVVGGVELSRSGYNGTFVGGMLSLKAFRMLIDAGAAVTIDKSHNLMFLLNVRW